MGSRGRSVSRRQIERLGKSHADACTNRGGKPDQECLPVIMSGERSCKQRCERRDGSVHQSGEARLHILQHKHTPLGLFLFFSCRRSEKLFFELSCSVSVAPFRSSKVAEKPSDSNIGGALSRFVIEPGRLKFHVLSLLPNRIKRQVARKPNRSST